MEDSAKIIPKILHDAQTIYVHLQPNLHGNTSKRGKIAAHIQTWRDKTQEEP